jgi:hypothetical protein
MLGRSLDVSLASMVQTSLSSERPDSITKVHSPSCEEPSSFFILAEFEFGRQIVAKKNSPHKI